MPENITVTQEITPNYSIKQSKTVLAKWGRDGKTALCGTCNHSLGEFKTADGVILCRSSTKNGRCYTRNIIVK